MYGIAEGQLLIPYYHMVSDEEPLHIKHLYKHKGMREFKEDLEFLLRHFKAISVADLIDITKGKKILTERCFLLTLDDGFREIYDVVAPILSKRGVPACFFIASAFTDNKEMSYDHKKSLLADRVKEGLTSAEESEIKRVLGDFGKYGNGTYENILRIEYTKKCQLDDLATAIGVDFHEYLRRIKPYLTPDQISELIQMGFGIGGHSIDHPLYSVLSLEEQLRQTVESVKTIRDTFAINYGAFAFPHSDAGVKVEFFESLNESGLVDISFGGGGFLGDEIRTNYHRLSFENPPLPAERLVKVEVARKLSRIITGKGTIKR
jgi:peptidoglycan/xylan/chitin deacetylase (PgdA/CDA1 family)